MREMAIRFIRSSFAVVMLVVLCSIFAAGQACADEPMEPGVQADTTSMDAHGSLTMLTTSIKAEEIVGETAAPDRGVALLEDGVYRIGVCGALSRCLESGGAVGAVSVRIAKASGASLAQRWKVRCTEGGFCTLTSVATGRKLGVNRKGAVVTGTAKALGARNAGVFRWAASVNADGTLQLVNKATGKALSATTRPSGKAVSAPVSADSRAQRVKFKRVSTLPSGKYLLFTKLAQTKQVVQIPHGAISLGVRARIGKTKGLNCERFVITRLEGDKDLYSIQSVTSGRYLVDRGGIVQQRSRTSGGKLAKTQQWHIDASGRGLTIENAATGRVLAVSGGKAKSGAALITSKDKGTSAQRFRAERLVRTIADGTYVFGSRAGKTRLDVKNASWNVGTNVRLWSPNASLAQKFNIRYVGHGYYRIRMAQAGTALAAQMSGKKKTVNVCMANAQSAAAQLWKPIVSDRGIMFENKATGTMLGAVGEGACGANVRVSVNRDMRTQAWRLEETSVNVASLSTLRAIVDHVPAGGNRTIKVDAKDTGYRLSKARRAQLEGALGEAWKRGANVSVVMVDLGTGVTLSIGPDRDNHGASTFKAAYVTYLFQDIIERRGGIDASSRYLMRQTIGYSSNEAYESLRSRFGTRGFRAWLDDVGLGHLAGQPFPRLTARNLARVWAKICSYEHSGGRHVGEWRNLFDHSYFSFIRERLGGSNKVYSKPGWYPRTGNWGALNDGAIVKDRKGRNYLLTILSNTNCYTNRWIMRNIAGALDAIHREMPQ